MSEKDLEVLITLDDPGEDELEEDRFHHLAADHTDQSWPAATDEKLKET